MDNIALSQRLSFEARKLKEKVQETDINSPMWKALATKWYSLDKRINSLRDEEICFFDDEKARLTLIQEVIDYPNEANTSIETINGFFDTIRKMSATEQFFAVQEFIEDNRFIAEFQDENDGYIRTNPFYIG